MSYDDYDLNPVKLALDFASLGDGALGLAELLHRQQAMFTDHGYSATEAELTLSHRVLLAALGQQLARVLHTDDEDDFLTALSLLLDAQDCAPHLTTHDAVSPHLHFARDGAPMPTWIAAMSVSGLALYVCRHGRSRLRRCAAAGCGRWHVDESKNASRKYCSAACASRTTVAAYRARIAGERRPSGPTGEIVESEA